MAKIRVLPMQPIAAQAGFVAEPESLTASLAQALDKLADVIGAVQKIAKLTDLPTARRIGDRDRNRRFKSIPTKRASCIRSVPPCPRLCAGLSDAILEGDMPWGGPPDASHGGHKV